MTDSIPVLSLFCGAGGLDLGFEKEGFRPFLAVDWDAAAVETYNWNRKRRKPALELDLFRINSAKLVEEWSRKSVNVPAGIIGGPPCQPFSLGNASKREDDPRADLSLKYAE